jgi:hypothetical protein
MSWSKQFVYWVPLQVFVFGTVFGWLGMTEVRGLVSDLPAVEASGEEAPPAVDVLPAVVEGAQPITTLSPVFTPEVQHWREKIMAWAGQYHLDPNLIATVMQIESCGAPHVVSRSGAQGLFQVMPFHFIAGEAMQDPDTNASRGLAYLASGLVRANHDVGLALAGYNGGHSLMTQASNVWSNETQRYWYWGTGIYAEALNGAVISERLQEWLNAGGASLCAKASDQLGVK